MSCHLPDKDDDLESKISSIIKKLNNDKNAWPFEKPVDAKEVPEYYDYTKFPIDLKTMHERLKRKYYVHVSLPRFADFQTVIPFQQHLFIADVRRMFENCYAFNGVSTVYYEMAYKLNELALKLLKTAFPGSPLYPELPARKPH